MRNRRAKERENFPDSDRRFAHIQAIMSLSDSIYFPSPDISHKTFSRKHAEAKENNEKCHHGGLGNFHDSQSRRRRVHASAKPFIELIIFVEIRSPFR